MNDKKTSYKNNEDPLETIWIDDVKYIEKYSNGDWNLVNTKNGYTEMHHPDGSYDLIIKNEPAIYFDPLGKKYFNGNGSMISTNMDTSYVIDDNNVIYVTEPLENNAKKTYVIDNYNKTMRVEEIKANGELSSYEIHDQNIGIVEKYHRDLLAGMNGEEAWKCVAYDSHGKPLYSFNSKDNEKYFNNGSEFFKVSKDAKLTVNKNGDVLTITDGESSYLMDLNSHNLIQKEILEDGNKNVYYYDNGSVCKQYIYDKNGDEKVVLYLESGKITLGNDGNFYDESNNINGKYEYDSSGNVILMYADGTKKLYNEKSKLIMENIGDDTVSYNYDKASQNINGIVSRINHIDFDEDKYYNLMASLINIYNSNYKSMDSYFHNISNIIESFPDQYSNNQCDSILDNINNHLSELNTLQSNINYSLLAYQSCDQNLKNTLNNLIDSLFENDSFLSNDFKESLSSFVEDRNRDGILEYKLDTNFNDIFYNYLPVKKYVDEDGNSFFFNNCGKLLSISGDNIKINYGGEKFNLSLGNNGCIILRDMNGNPLNIFGDYNLETYQYGGNQLDFAYNGTDYLVNSTMNKIINHYFPSATDEEKLAFYEKISYCGCGYVALSNIAFKSMEGHEEEFLDKFGYSMYNISYDDFNNCLSVDYNYEPLILEMFSQSCLKSGYDNIKDATKLSEGADVQTQHDLYDYLCDKYMINKYNNPNVECVSDFGFSLYDTNNMCYDDNYPHVMVITDNSEDSQYVSSWGQKYIYEQSVNKSYYDDYYRDFRGDNV